MFTMSRIRGRGRAIPPSGGGGDPTPPPTTGRPDATNTGYVNEPSYPGSLTAGPSTITSNTTYSYREFLNGTDVGSIDAHVSNVTFVGCRFAATGEYNILLFGDNITFRYCTIEPAAVSAPPTTHAQGYQYGLEGTGGYYSSIGQLTVENCNIWGFAEGIDVLGSTQAKPHVFRNNWIHDPRDDGGTDHTDGLGNQSGGGSSNYVVMDNNSIMAKGNTQAIAWQGGTYDHMTVTNNIVSGYGYTMSFDGNFTNLTFTDNVYSTEFKPDWGPIREDVTAYPGLVWRRNKWYHPPNATWGNAADDGKFWMPVVSTSANSSTYVSTTDYM